MLALPGQAGRQWPVFCHRCRQHHAASPAWLCRQVMAAVRPPVYSLWLQGLLPLVRARVLLIRRMSRKHCPSDCRPPVVTRVPVPVWTWMQQEPVPKRQMPVPVLPYHPTQEQGRLLSDWQAPAPGRPMYWRTCCWRSLNCQMNWRQRVLVRARPEWRAARLQLQRVPRVRVPVQRSHRMMLRLSGWLQLLLAL